MTAVQPEVECSVQNAMFVLGASDPEMRAIERLLKTVAAPFVYATVDGKRVYPANAYAAEAPAAVNAALADGGYAWLVECVGQTPAGAARIDHHHAGDPGYGRPPAQFWEASSLGQTVAALDRLGSRVAITPDMRMVAVADHCLGAAYAGECPGVDPDDLMRWHVAARAAFERRPESAVLQDVESARHALRQAPRLELGPGIFAADMRAQPVTELLMAAAREGQCCVSAVKTRDGRTKIGCLVGSEIQVATFMETWAPAQHLVDVYGDSVRGFAGAYLPPQ
jgi:hypothetical protein